ncbi:MAG: hypothetical protein RBR15_03540 [Sphaerochaeta sp.]|nr:hypothetical protein [Sphaerochaeta sp.]
MKKTMLVIAMILIIATSGLFAAVVNPGTVTATLKATINEFLLHGFNDGVTKYLPAIDVTDAFNAVTPSFKYGYTTNAAPYNFTFTMNVGDFENQNIPGNYVKIQSVASSGGQFLQIGATRNFQVFVYNALTNILKLDETTLTITPFLTFTGGNDITGNPISTSQAVSGAPPGNYEAPIVFTITGV